MKLTPKLINFAPVGFVDIPENPASIDAENPDDFPRIWFAEDSKEYGLPFVDIPT